MDGQRQRAVAVSDPRIAGGACHRALSSCQSWKARFDIVCKAHGGGLSGQAGAIRLAMARAIILFNPELRKLLKSAGMLTRDPRMVERKKYGMVKARKRFQFSKR